MEWDTIGMSHSVVGFDDRKDVDEELEMRNPTNEGDDALIDYMEKAPEPLPPRDPIGPPDVQPSEAPIETDE